jgi:hypothetical protein
MQTNMEGPHERLCSNTNKSEMQTGRSDCWSNWRYVLNELMHLPGVQEGAGIQSCIRDVLLYGCAKFGSVSRKTKDYWKTINCFVVMLLFSNQIVLLGYKFVKFESFKACSLDATFCFEPTLFQSLFL